jgi:hypothetical protein
MPQPLKDVFTTVHAIGFVEPAAGSPYSGHWAVVSLPNPTSSPVVGTSTDARNQDVLGLGFGVPHKIGDSSLYINKETGKPVFADESTEGSPSIRMQFEAYREAKGQNSRMAKMRKAGAVTETPVRDAAMKAADDVLERLNDLNDLHKGLNL